MNYHAITLIWGRMNTIRNIRKASTSGTGFSILSAYSQDIILDTVFRIPIFRCLQRKLQQTRQRFP